MKWGLIGATAAFVTLAGTSPASASFPCQDRGAVLAKLAKDYAEAPIAIGMASNGGVFEVMATGVDNSSFTIIVTMPNGMACMAASGQNFEMLNMATAAKGDPI
jgi:hypothetical protein